MRTISKTAERRLSAELEAIPRLDRKNLIARWREFYGSAPPSRFSRPLMIRAISYKIQERALGGLKASTRRMLMQAYKPPADGGLATVPPRSLRPGSVLVRQWQGVSHHVTVLENNLLYRGKQYRSLSEVARLITGSRWSGPRFFGLKPEKTHDPAQTRA